VLLQVQAEIRAEYRDAMTCTRGATGSLNEDRDAITSGRGAIREQKNFTRRDTLRSRRDWMS